MHYKRGRSRRQIRCSLCTPHRWHGNNHGRFKEKDVARMQAPVEEIGPHEHDGWDYWGRKNDWDDWR